jgi:hypothetical protein
MKRLIPILILVIAVVATASAQTKQRVRFARGETSATVSGTVRGYAYVDYVLGASAGQILDVHLDKNTSSVFTIFKPGGGNLEGAAEMNEFSIALSSSGDYVIRVMMMRAEARRSHSVSNYKLTISIK